MTYYFKMANSLRISVFICTSLYAGVVLSQNRHNSYATILQDTRNEPTPDGTFGYMYKTEDGILSVARGDPTGLIQALHLTKWSMYHKVTSQESEDLYTLM
ncbi:unnamed protein product [Acanthoscelides obtectus]|uniref:Uncharacterized protein n=1 Tax=Acanthoscelides obtectus TaxID=200917 RepID=A0A9P0KFI6_ACAOB|nr:unnamed protein product [Acanthoscelides obtectus]CAK1666664.1 hypothetical protein AOBTE_LOCUS25426 [Acanthoscelides obtectus]